MRLAEFQATITNGQVHVADSATWSRFKANNEGKEIILKVDSPGESYSSKQNNFWHMLGGLGAKAAGYVSKDDFMDDVKINFGYYYLGKDLTGKEKKYPKSITTGDKETMMELITKMVVFLDETYGIKVDTARYNALCDHYRALKTKEYEISKKNSERG